jgi:hypothetical protein
VLAGLETHYYVKASGMIYNTAWTLQHAAKVKRNYELKKIVLAEQERLDTSKRELNGAKAVADEETINMRNME